MEPVVLALCASAAALGPAAAAYVLWRVSRRRGPPPPASDAVGALIATRRVVREAFVMDRPLGAVQVSCETHRTGRQVVVLRVEVPGEVWVEPVRPLRLTAQVLGDPAFDRRFECGGEIVLLTAEVRAMLVEASRVLDLRVVGGTLEARWSTTHEGRTSPLALTLEPHADRVVAIARAMPADPDDAWVHTAIHDPSPAVRVRALAFLVESGNRRASLALDAGRRSDVPEVALFAARYALDLAVLRRLACDEASPADVRRAALDALFQHDRPDGLAPVVLALASSDAVVDLVSVLDRHGDERLVLLAATELRIARRALPAEARDDAQHALAGILGRLPPSARVEDELLDLLRRTRDPHTHRAAARSLGAVGTGRSVPALRALRDPDTARAALQAIREIQGRVAGQEGGMALADEHPAVGALSPASFPAGHLAEPR
jgi:hypothetical protein